MKLGAFAPRFLLESVEGGERLARYSFIGFGDALEVRLDHLTRGIALLHAGTEAERQALRAQVVRALRGALPNGRRAGRYAPPVAAFPRADYMAGVRRTQQYIAAGDVYQLVLASRFSGRHELDPFPAYRALRLITPSPYIY